MELPTSRSDHSITNSQNNITKKEELQLATTVTMRSTTSLRTFQPTRRMMVPVPKEDQSAHTISQRLRQWRRIPPELVPLGIVVGVAVAFGAYSLGAKLMDKQMRLSRQNRSDHD